jgi:cytidine deaminase
MSEPTVDRLIESARAVHDFAYAPYSKFRVGAAVLTDTGKVFVGCNVENASYGATLCAERSALANMIASGERRAVAVAIFVDAAEPAMPCGICRQWLAELGPDALVISATPNATKRSTMHELLPDPFVFRP